MMDFSAGFSVVSRANPSGVGAQIRNKKSAELNYLPGVSVSAYTFVCS